jgi:hypothetical protein
MLDQRGQLHVHAGLPRLRVNASQPVVPLQHRSSAAYKAKGRACDWLPAVAIHVTGLSVITPRVQLVKLTEQM